MNGERSTALPRHVPSDNANSLSNFTNQLNGVKLKPHRIPRAIARWTLLLAEKSLAFAPSLADFLSGRIDVKEREARLLSLITWESLSLGARSYTTVSNCAVPRVFAVSAYGEHDKQYCAKPAHISEGRLRVATP